MKMSDVERSRNHCDPLLGELTGRVANVLRLLIFQPLLFLEKSKGNPEKNKGFSPRGTPKILGKERKNAQKTREIGKRKSKESKKQGLEGQGFSDQGRPYAEIFS